jgi:hypothetical protein
MESLAAFPMMLERDRKGEVETCSAGGTVRASPPSRRDEAAADAGARVQLDPMRQGDCATLDAR